MSRRSRAGRTGRTVVGALLGVVVVLAIVAAGLVVLQPRLVGPPLPRDVVLGVLAKPDPPKLRALAGEGAGTKPVAVDLGTVPAPVTVAAPDDQVAQDLVARLQQAVSQAGDAGPSAVHVMDADGRTVFDLGGTVPLIPASTAKLATAAMALLAFGPDHVFTTRVGATATPDGAGLVAGDLVVQGGGDPTLVSDTYVAARTNPERPMTPLSALADQVVAAGVTHVTGSVVGDAGFLAGDPLAQGWPLRYLEDLDATPIAGLTIDQGLQFFDEGAGLRARAAPDPPAEAAAALTTALRERGVVVDGMPRSSTAPLPEQEPPSFEAGGPAVVTGLARVDSAPLTTLLRWMVQNSDNHVADTLFRAAGRHAAGRGSFADAGALVDDVTTALQLDWSTTVLHDGSGLSRDSLIPPALLTTLNYRMTNSAVGAVWQDLMAVSGVSGTLQRRLTGTIAELRLRGKTGSLGDVRAFTGAVVGPDGRPLYVTVTSNGLQRAQLDDARRLQDLVILTLAAQLYGCTEVPPPPPTAPLPPDELPPLPTHTC